MGNVPAKLDEQSSYSQYDSGSFKSGSGRSMSASASSGNRNMSENAENTVVRSRRGTSLVGNILSASGRARADSAGGGSSVPYKKKSTKEREQMKENHAKELIARYDECVDGGFLAPYGCYGPDKLDFNAEIVKQLIIGRKLAPFYIPLQDFDESWTKEELIKIVDGLPLHEPFIENPEEFEDVPVGNIRKQNFEDLIDKSLSKREQRRLRSKIFKARLHRKRIIWQEMENEVYLEQKLESKQKGPAPKNNQWLMSDDLKYSLYKNGMECPICFLYFPKPLNYSRCCLQPICTECFVQIKRADPHFPHDEVDPTKPVTDDDDKDPNLLTSEPANCVYCATSNFGVTYEPPTDRRVGIGGIPPATFKKKSDERNDKKNDDEDDRSDEESNQDSNDRKVNSDTAETPRRRGSRSHDDPLVVSSDTIRPDWSTKLNKERMRLAKRSATATAIHVSNQLVDPQHPSRRGSGTDLESGSYGYSNSSWSQSSRPRASSMLDPGIREAENEMIQQAIRLSLADEKQRKKNKANAKSH
ncbi:hypothetical protein HG535_0D01000 [Zygotorulaspora mrakii]|uniref:Protein SIP5 n=1 Tax=Zygotorulaspora mrakii TaxID=42260 RepID=A0A7H9B3R3_ZYGMR|nr:uncharacterized protein HG535_0D01000 [Zygotorulaspora mrakii]QLG72392.1 hypothetical protein HG535_0D01000 [Zygotorulaspora mrakii]